MFVNGTLSEVQESTQKSVSKQYFIDKLYGLNAYLVDNCMLVTTITCEKRETEFLIDSGAVLSVANMEVYKHNFH